MKYRYVPELHDPILTDLVVRLKRTDQEASDAMGFCRDTITSNRTRLGLPRNLRCPLKKAPAEKPGFTPVNRPNPVALAIQTLGRRLQERPSGYFLDGRPVNTVTLVKEANRVRLNTGLRQIGPSHWHV